jgi:hypothetical protein
VTGSREFGEALANLRTEVGRYVLPVVRTVDRLLRRWPWLYRRLGGTL